MKKLPELTTDNHVEAFIDAADLAQYDVSALEPMQFEFQRKERSITLRLSNSLFDAIKQEAMRSNIPYQRFIRQTLENALQAKVKII